MEEEKNSKLSKENSKKEGLENIPPEVEKILEM